MSDFIYSKGKTNEMKKKIAKFPYKLERNKYSYFQEISNQLKIRIFIFTDLFAGKWKLKSKTKGKLIFIYC